MSRQSVAAPTGGAARMPGMVDAVEAGGFVFFSAIRGRRPDDDRFEPAIEAQAQQAFANVARSLEAMGMSLDDVVKVTVFLADLELRSGFHRVWTGTFGAEPPARTVVHVDDANAAPGGAALFVLDVVAWRG